MKYPTLTVLPTTRQMVDTFGGYNHNLRIRDGEFFDMKNMTSVHYPVLSPRVQRGAHIREDGNVSAQALVAKDSLCYLDGTTFYMNDAPYDLSNLISTDDADYPKQLVSMGAYVIILPDKVYFNTENGESGRIEAEFVSEGKITFSLCTIDGSEYGDVETTEPALEDRVSGQYWLDTSSDPHSLKCWSASSGMWVSVGTTYIKISAPGIGAAFNQYDGVTISGLSSGLTDGAVDEYGNLVIIQDENISALDGSFVIWAKDEDSIVVIGMLEKERTLINEVTVKRAMPTMDFVVESENRLWGCHYGIVNGEVVNEIYASKLGDFRNWNCFMGVSTDSYVASVGSDGQFTGAITHLGYPIFFKETCMHKVYGNFPANYQIQTTACRGVQKGCGRSLAIVNETLYYKSRSGVCAYDGSLPAEISMQLGDMKYSDAVAGSHGNKYYISMKDVSDVYHLFVYDTAKGLWHKEDNTQVDAFCSCRGEMYYIDHADGYIKTVFGSGRLDTDPIEWMAETGVLTAETPDKKYISRLTIRMALAFGTRVHIFAEYNSSGAWDHLFTMTGNSLRSFAVPIRPKRCDHLRLRFIGEGDAKIYSITKTIEQGSDY